MYMQPITLAINDVDCDFVVTYTPSKYEPPTRTEEAINEDLEIHSLIFNGNGYVDDAGFLINIFIGDIKEQIDG